MKTWLTGYSVLSEHDYQLEQKISIFNDLIFSMEVKKAVALKAYSAPSLSLS